MHSSSIAQLIQGNNRFQKLASYKNAFDLNGPTFGEMNPFAPNEFLPTAPEAEYGKITRRGPRREDRRVVTNRDPVVTPGLSEMPGINNTPVGLDLIPSPYRPVSMNTIQGQLSPEQMGIPTGGSSPRDYYLNDDDLIANNPQLVQPPSLMDGLKSIYHKLKGKYDGLSDNQRLGLGVGAGVLGAGGILALMEMNRRRQEEEDRRRMMMYRGY